jgi:hypothetical protein
MAKKEPKYRPYLSLREIDIILSHLTTYAPTERELISTFRTLSFKASSGVINPSYVTSPIVPKFSLEGLGLSDSSAIGEEDMSDEDIAKLEESLANLSSLSKKE